MRKSRHLKTKKTGVVIYHSLSRSHPNHICNLIVNNLPKQDCDSKKQRKEIMLRISTKPGLNYMKWQFFDSKAPMKPK
jgi:hypothetical protein